MFISLVRQKFLATLVLKHNILICKKFVFKDTARQREVATQVFKHLRDSKVSSDTRVQETIHQNTWDFSTLALSLSHMADTSRPSAFS